MQGKHSIFSTKTVEDKTVSADQKFESVPNKAIGEKCGPEYTSCLKDSLFYQITRSGHRRQTITNETSERCYKKYEDCIASHVVNGKN